MNRCSFDLGVDVQIIHEQDKLNSISMDKARQGPRKRKVIPVAQSAFPTQFDSDP